MKKTFDILNISPTQWVLVDKTRIPRMNEVLLRILNGVPHSIQSRSIPDDREYPIGEFIPILAAYPKIEGVLLLPSILWEKKRTVEESFEKHINYFLFRDAPIRNEKTRSDALPHFKAGYEAAGGYTMEDMRNAAMWGFTLSDKYDSLDEEAFEDVMERVEKDRKVSPRALVIDVNEDGSIPSENDTIIYTEVIY